MVVVQSDEHNTEVEHQEQKCIEEKQRNLFWKVLWSPLTLVKLAFFFYYMGSNEINAFSSLYYKQQGLTIAHISAISSISGIVEAVVSFSSAVILDKFGKAKLILLALIAISILGSLGLVLSPSLQSCYEAEYLLYCNNTVNVKMNCNRGSTASLTNCSSFHSLDIYKNQTPYDCSNFDVTQRRIFPEKLLPEESKLSFSHKIRFVEGQSVIECDLNDSGNHDTNCLQRENKCSKVNYDNTLLLVLYGFLICLFSLSHSSTHRFYDFIGVSLSAQHGTDFGKQYLFGEIGYILGPLAVGYAIRALHTEGSPNYNIAFMVFMVLAFLSGLSICNVNCQAKEPSEKVWKELFSLLKKPDVVIFLIVLLVMGTFFKFNLLYLGLFQEELGSSAFIIGLTSMLMNVCGLPFLLTSKWWIQKLGNHTIFSLALFMAAAFHASVSFVETSTPIMFLGMTNIFTYHLLWMAAINFARTIASEKVSGTVIVTAGLVFFNISKASASLVGGMVMSGYGSRTAFRVIGAMCLLTGTFYLFWIYLSSKRKSENHQSCNYLE